VIRKTANLMAHKERRVHKETRICMILVARLRVF